VISAKWEGKFQAGAQMTTRTLTRFERFQANQVLNWWSRVVKDANIKL
jgi:hypothetical protein